MYDGIMGSFILSLIMGLVPVLLASVFSRFMVLKSKNAWQLMLQRWYTYFLFTFVLLATALGSSLMQTGERLLQHPLLVVFLLADTLPMATHFYLNYIALQWSALVVDFLRPAVLSKFVVLRAFFEDKDEEARKNSEPEDQNSHGMGARTAVMTLTFVVGLVFCSLMPVILIFTAVNFFICRLVYGYLTVYAETRKPDLGGEFWPQQLQFAQQGIFIYIALMTGVLLNRASTLYPGALAASAMVLQAESYRRFLHQFRWETLPMEHLHKDHTYETKKRAPTRQSYEQEELIEEYPSRTGKAEEASSSTSAFGRQVRKLC